MTTNGVRSLRCLAASAAGANTIKPNSTTWPSDSLGGLRHTRNKLKLDLPPSPSSFTSTRSFNIEMSSDPVIHREPPTFTTFGKSRFSVQHVPTPTEDETNDSNKSKNVSFEALPHKPIKTYDDHTKYVISPANENTDEKHKQVEVVRGEASLLDSADEDSGIESSTNATLERPVINDV